MEVEKSNKGINLFQRNYGFDLLKDVSKVVDKQGFTPIAYAKICWENPREETPGRSHKNEPRANPYKGMTPPSTQNLKTLGL